MNYHQVAKDKFPNFNKSEVDDFVVAFKSFDKENTGSVDSRELIKLCRQVGENIKYDESIKLINAVDTDKSGTVEFHEFLTIIKKIREMNLKGGSLSNPDLSRSQGKIVLGGATDSTTHTINEEEKEQFVFHINSVLKNDKDIGSRFPIDGKNMSIFEQCKDGLILSKLINDSVPGFIDERVLNVGNKMNPFHMTENNNVVISSSKAIGCSVVNIGSQDLIEGRPHLVLGLIWQIIKIGLLSKINLQVHPELYRLLEKGEALEDFLKLPADAILLRWFNYHLKAANHGRKVNNFAGDLKDSENYTVLLNQLAPELCSRDALRVTDLHERAEAMLREADKLDCRKYVTPHSIVQGNPRLNLAFVANLFNKHPGLAPLTQEEMAALDEGLFASLGDRESRAFALWMNSLGVDPFVNNIFDDLRDGLVLLQCFDKIHPGIVQWKQVNTKTPVASKFKKVENTNYAVVIGKSLQFSLVGIQGSDITDGNKTLTLGLVWQMMRDHVIQTLKSLSKNGVEIRDNDLISWANSTVKRNTTSVVPKGASNSISSFKDSSLRNGHFFLQLLAGIKKGIVNPELVTPGVSDDEAKLNAKYAISIARKLGATIFLLPEDIIEVKPKMILTFIGALMAIDRQLNTGA